MRSWTTPRFGTRHERGKPGNYQAKPRQSRSLIVARLIVPAAFREPDTAAVLTGLSLLRPGRSLLPVRPLIVARLIVPAAFREPDTAAVLTGPL